MTALPRWVVVVAMNDEEGALDVDISIQVVQPPRGERARVGHALELDRPIAQARLTEAAARTK